jgi:hypothetical protein
MEGEGEGMKEGRGRVRDKYRRAMQQIQPLATAALFMHPQLK